MALPYLDSNNVDSVTWPNCTKEIRRSQSAVLTDGRDRRGHRLVSIIGPPKLTRWQRLTTDHQPYLHLRRVVQHLISFLTAHDVQRGITVVADLRQHSQADFNALCQIIDYITKNDVRIASAFIIKPSEKKISSNCLKTSSNPSTYFQVHMLEHLEALRQYIHPEDLLPQFGGSSRFHFAAFLRFVEMFDKLEYFTSSTFNRTLLICENFQKQKTNLTFPSQLVFEETFTTRPLSQLEESNYILENQSKLHHPNVQLSQTEPSTTSESKLNEPMGSSKDKWIQNQHSPSTKLRIQRSFRSRMGPEEINPFEMIKLNELEIKMKETGLEEAINQCDRIYKKFTNCQSYRGLSELSNHPVFERAILVLVDRQAKLRSVQNAMRCLVGLPCLPGLQADQPVNMQEDDSLLHIASNIPKENPTQENIDYFKNINLAERERIPTPTLSQNISKTCSPTLTQSSNTIAGENLNNERLCFKAVGASTLSRLGVQRTRDQSRPESFNYESMEDSISIETISTMSIEGETRYNEVELFKEIPRSFEEIEASGVLTLLTLAKRSRAKKILSTQTSSDDKNALIRSRILESFRVNNNRSNPTMDSPKHVTEEIAYSKISYKNMNELPVQPLEQTNLNTPSPKKPARRNFNQVNNPVYHENIECANEVEITVKNMPITEAVMDEERQIVPKHVVRHKSVEKVAAFSQMMKDYLEKKRKSSIGQSNLRQSLVENIQMTKMDSTDHGNAHDENNKKPLSIFNKKSSLDNADHLASQGHDNHGILGDNDILIDSLRKDLGIYQTKPKSAEDSNTNYLAIKHKDNLSFQSSSHELKPYRKRLMMMNVNDDVTMTTTLANNTDTDLNQTKSPVRKIENTDLKWNNVFESKKENEMIEGIDIENWLGVTNGNPTYRQSSIKSIENPIDYDFAKEIKHLQDLALLDMRDGRTNYFASSRPRSMDARAFIRNTYLPNTISTRPSQHHYDYPSSSRRQQSLNSHLLLSTYMDKDLSKDTRYSPYHFQDIGGRSFFHGKDENYADNSALLASTNRYMDSIHDYNRRESEHYAFSYRPYSPLYSTPRPIDNYISKQPSIESLFQGSNNNSHNDVVPSHIYSIPINWNERYDEQMAGTGKVVGDARQRRNRVDKLLENRSVMSEESGVYTIDTESRSRFAD